jgi:hypothetical protein
MGRGEMGRGKMGQRGEMGMGRNGIGAKREGAKWEGAKWEGAKLEGYVALIDLVLGANRPHGLGASNGANMHSDSESDIIMICSGANSPDTYIMT